MTNPSISRYLLGLLSLLLMCGSLGVVAVAVRRHFLA